MPGIGIILNRNAGKYQSFRGRIGEKLGFVLGDPTSLWETGSVEEIEDVARKFLERKLDILGISGGDGSNHYVLSAFLRIYGDAPLPKVAFLCGGTHNAHAASIGLCGTPEKLLENIVRKYHTQEKFNLVARCILRVDDGLGVRHGFSMATGFMFRFMEELQQKQKDSPIKVAALLVSWIGSGIVGGKRIRTLFRLEPAKVTVSGRRIPWERINGVSASSMERLGLGFVPYPRAGETPTTFHVGVLKIKPAGFIKLMWYYKNAKSPDHPDLYNNISDHVLLEAESPISYVLDGEIYHGTNRLEIRSGRTLDLIVG
jgi:diacylglycerol kinase (ATP)